MFMETRVILIGTYFALTKRQNCHETVLPPYCNSCNQRGVQQHLALTASVARNTRIHCCVCIDAAGHVADVAKVQR